jgi:hypothetical protein
MLGQFYEGVILCRDNIYEIADFIRKTGLCAVTLYDFTSLHVTDKDGRNIMYVAGDMIKYSYGSFCVVANDLLC